MSIVRRAAYAAGMVIRETGQALDRVGCSLQGSYAYKEQLSRHRQIMNLSTDKPIISADVFVAPSASVIGNVELSSSSSVWYGAVIRGDTAPIAIGARAAIADRAVVRGATRVGAGALVSAGAVIDGAEVGDGAMIGAGAVLSSGVRVAAGAIIRPSSFVAPGQAVAADEVWAGVPAVKIGDVDAAERARFEEEVAGTVELARAHADECGKTHEQIEAEALRQTLLEERSEDYNSHIGTLGREREAVEVQARIVEEDREAQRKIGTA